MSRFPIVWVALVVSMGCNRETEHPDSPETAPPAAAAHSKCDATVLKQAAADAKAARAAWSPDSGKVFDHADAGAKAIASACPDQPAVVAWALDRTVELRAVATGEGEGTHPRPLVQADWDDVAADLCPSVVAISASEAGRTAQTLYDECKLTPSSGMSRQAFVDARGTIVTIALLKMRRWLADQADEATADALTLTLLDRWRSPREELVEADLAIPAVTRGQALPADPITVRVGVSDVWVGPQKVAANAEPELESIVRDALAESMTAAREAGRGRQVVVAAGRDLSASVLEPIRRGLAATGVDSLALLVLVDDVDAPLRTVIVEPGSPTEAKTIQDVARESAR